MKENLILFCLYFICASSIAQNNYWQQEVNFNINVSLNDKEHTLDAFETIDYINNSPDTLRFIWFHIWPNAYKNDRTAFSEQLLKERRTDFYFSSQNQKGYINQLDFKVDNATAVTIPDSNNIDVIKVLLPKPIAPGSKAVITTPFKVKLPYNISRGGHVGNDYQVTQWFPKPAVYDRYGWHPMPYLDQGEFYSEFGSFDVEITAPSAYIVAATGVLQDAETLQQIKQNGKHTVEGSTKTWHYKQSNVHDFAWFAGKSFTVKYDTAVLPSGKVVDLFSYQKPHPKGWIDMSVKAVKKGIQKYSEWIGEYPYTVASIVQGPPNVNAGGMEYPTIALINKPAALPSMDEVTVVHEVGHNWFYGALASNEREHTWMDEGMNTYYQRRYEKERKSNTKHTPKKKRADLFSNKTPVDDEKMLTETIIKLSKDQPLETPAPEFSSTNYGLMNYVKAPLLLEKMEKEMGKEAFDRSMKEYYSQWKFKHPYPADFKSAFEKTSTQSIDSNYTLLFRTGDINPPQHKTIKPTVFFNLRNTDKYNYISIAPAVGYNYYDKGMIGGLIHNYQLPLNKLQFIGGLLYATGSKSTNGFGRISYNVYKRRMNVSTSVSYITYNMDRYKVEANSNLYLRVQRTVPSVYFTFFDKDANSTRRFNAGFKTFVLNEGHLDFKTIINSPDTFDVVGIVKQRSYINRLTLSVSDNRVLFPYSINITADQGKDFIRTGLTAKYFFNYPDGKTGMSARLFAGKFFYLTSKTFLTRYNNDRYLLNLSAPKGYEDYTYSDYFVGRNEFEGWRSQQVMERDGFFKVNTELLSDKVGKTDDWLMALNLTSGLPDKYNPLSVLPFKIPLRLFLDVGTYAEAWKNNPATGRFVYDAGIEIPLFHSLINIYVPLIYSKVYSNYYKSTITENRFMKTISFSINIQQLSLRNLIKEIPL